MNKKYIWLILSFGIAKFFIHLGTMTNYALHRDEYLYFDEGKHLGWGFMEVPPLTPFIGKLAGLMGGSVFAIRLFPMLIGVATIILAGMLVRDLGGKKWAITFTGLGLLFSPALLGSNALFQPVSFNQFFWFLSAYFLVQIIRTEQTKFWYYLGLSIGIGFLTKYSIFFYGVGLGIALLLTPQRKWLTTKYPYIALAIALVIASPNLYWQYDHNLPVMAHMRELSESQLVNMDWWYYLSSQVRFHFGFTIIWLAGLIGFFKIGKLKPYRFLGIGFLLTILLIGLLSGKHYYTIGAFTILFPFGGIALEHWLQKDFSKYALIVGMCVLTFPLLPYAMPLLQVDQMKKYCAFMSKNAGMKNQLRWEDGNYYEIPQDLADMNGWEELVKKVAKIYHGLPKDKKEKCMIYGGSYGHAGSLNYFREKYDLPEAYSFNSSYLMWAPDEVDFNNQIMLDDRFSLESTWFKNVELVDSMENPFARDPGYIYYRDEPMVDVNEAWRNYVKEEKEEFNF